MAKVDYRYMVDYTMFRRMHPSKSIFVYQKDDLGEAMNKNEPPDDDFLAMLPAQIHAFDLSTKSWSREPSFMFYCDRGTDIMMQSS